MQVLCWCRYSPHEHLKGGDLECVLPTHALPPPHPDLQIGYRHVVDATLQEEACSLASLLVAVTSKGVVTCMRKVGKGSLDPESIFEMMEVRLVLRQVLGPGWECLLLPAPQSCCGHSPHLPPSPQAWSLESSWCELDVSELAKGAGRERGGLRDRDLPPAHNSCLSSASLIPGSMFLKENA